MYRKFSRLAAMLVVVGGMWVAPAAAAADESLTIAGEAYCDQFNNRFDVVWMISQGGNAVANVISATALPAGSTLDYFGGTVPASPEIVSVNQSLPTSAENMTATLTISASRGGTTLSGTGTVEVTGKCVGQLPSVTFLGQCDGSALVTLANSPFATIDVNLTVRNMDGDLQDQYVLKPGDVKPVIVPANETGALWVYETSRNSSFSVLAPSPLPKADGCTPTGGPSTPGSGGGDHNGEHPGGSTSGHPTTAATTRPPATTPASTSSPLWAAPVGSLPMTGQSSGVLMTTMTAGVLAVAVGIGFVFVARRRSAVLAAAKASTTSIRPVPPEAPAQNREH